MRMAALNTQRLRAVDAVRSSDNGAHCNESPESVACGGVDVGRSTGGVRGCKASAWSAASPASASSG